MPGWLHRLRPRFGPASNADAGSPDSPLPEVDDYASDQPSPLPSSLSPGLGVDSDQARPDFSLLASPLALGVPGPVIEPRPISAGFRAVPYRPDSVLDGWSSDRFTVRAASLRGHLHRHNGAPRQDDYALSYRAAPERLVIAVADGVSSATQSHLGATIAARFALEWLTTQCASQDSAFDWSELMRHCAWQLVEQASLLFPDEKKQIPDPEYAESMLATTLVCAIVDFSDAADRTTAHVAGVGDSAAWVIKNREFECVYGAKSSDDSQITSSAVAGLPKVPRDLNGVTIELPVGSVLLLGTDGFGDPLGSGRGLVGRTFAERLSAPPRPLEFAHLLDFTRETFDDDRTLVALWPKAKK